METGPNVSSRDVRAMAHQRVKLCRVALLKDCATHCIFAGTVEIRDEGQEIAVALGFNGHVVICDIRHNNNLILRQPQRETTLMHIFCQGRLILLRFLLEHSHKKLGHRIQDALRALKSGNFQSVFQVFRENFRGLHEELDHAKMTPLSRLIQQMASRECLIPWHGVFEELVKLKIEWESDVSSAIRFILDKLCLVDYLRRSCENDCGDSCVHALFQTLMKYNKSQVKKNSFQYAIDQGNFRLLEIFLKHHFSNNADSYIVTHVRGIEGSSIPILVYLLKSNLCREKMDEGQQLYLVKMIADVSRVDIHGTDPDGYNAIVYTALYKMRSPFFALLNHSKFNPNWTNGEGESLEDLFLWCDIDRTNPPAFAALRKKMGRRISRRQETPLSSPTENGGFSDLPDGLVSSSTFSLEASFFEENIQKNFSDLCRDLDPEGPLLDFLVQNDVVPMRTIDIILSEKTRHAKARRILTLVLRSGRKGRRSLLDGLKFSGQHHLYDLLKPPSMNSLTSQQDSFSEDDTLTRNTKSSLPLFDDLSIQNSNFLVISSRESDPGNSMGSEIESV